MQGEPPDDALDRMIDGVARAVVVRTPPPSLRAGVQARLGPRSRGGQGRRRLVAILLGSEALLPAVPLVVVDRPVRRELAVVRHQRVGELVDRGDRVQGPDPTLRVRRDEHRFLHRVVVSLQRSLPGLDGRWVDLTARCPERRCEVDVEGLDLMPVAEADRGLPLHLLPEVLCGVDRLCLIDHDTLTVCSETRSRLS